MIQWVLDKIQDIRDRFDERDDSEECEEEKPSIFEYGADWVAQCYGER